MIRSPIEGLYLCGASTLSHGVMGATASGLQAAGLALGVSSDALLAKGGKPITVEPAERLVDESPADYAFPIDAPGTSL